MLKTELVTTDFFDPEAIRIQPYDIYRVSFNKFRAYYRWFEDDPKLYSSLTTAIHHSMPMAEGLLDYYLKHGRNEADRLTKIAANYGTLMHTTIGKYCRSQEFNFNTEHCQALVNEYCGEIEFWEPECKEWARRLQEDLLAWVQFENDYNLKPIAIELILCSDRYGYATPIDVVAYADVPTRGYHGEVYKTGKNAGQPKITEKTERTLILINMKSGRKGIYDTHRVQMEFEGRLFEENYPDMGKPRICNWAPNEWKSDNPTYKLVDQTGKTSDNEFEGVRLIADARFTEKLYEKEYTYIYGEHTKGNTTSKNITKVDIIEHLKRQRNRLILPSNDDKD